MLRSISNNDSIRNMTEAAGLWWSDSDSDSDSNNLRNIVPNNTISNMDEVDDFSDNDSNIDNIRNIRSSNYENDVMDLLNVENNLTIESIFNEVENRYYINRNNENH
ncbi:unnamed protein product [Macrosiphum euphorbiae]|uniref:Uncharacterized protein n=1 Tax=Macrosiphum euphorbiae TaxID=13131 RepID=A0AAV0WC57_9HEMI|nr:unnamed protein product [Macrosiphum euphorbiae]